MKSKHNILALVVGKRLQKKDERRKKEKEEEEIGCRSSFFLSTQGKEQGNGLNIDLRKVAFYPSESVSVCLNFSCTS
jgi:sulfur transfer protein SufE